MWENCIQKNFDVKFKTLKETSLPVCLSLSLFVLLLNTDYNAKFDEMLGAFVG